MNGLEFIAATDRKPFYLEAFLKSILYGYFLLVENKQTYSVAEILEIQKRIHKTESPHNELEDYLCTDLIAKFVRPNMHLFGLTDWVVNNGVRETKENITVGHLDVKFEMPSLLGDRYYIFEAKRLDKNKRKQKYYITDGIGRFTERKYYPEVDTVVAGMIGFIELDLTAKRTPKRLGIVEIKKAINALIQNTASIKTTQYLQDYKINDTSNLNINNFNYLYLSKHLRDDDAQELSIYHLFLDYYDILGN